MKQTEHWAKIRKVFERLSLHAFRVEETRVVGVPDVNFALGWIELKQIKAKPRGLTKFGLTENQARWLIKRANSGGLCWVSLAIGDELYLLPGRLAGDDVLRGGMYMEDIRGGAKAIGVNGYGVYFEDLVKALDIPRKSGGVLSAA